MSSNRLMELQDELGSGAAEAYDDTAATANEEAGLALARTKSAGRARRRGRARRSPALRAQAQALAAARPIQFRVPGSVPQVAAPGSLNAWAAALTMLISWRDRASLGVEAAVGRAGPRFVDLLRRNEGVPVSAKAELLAAAGLAANPPARLAPEDWEMLLREHGPLWVTDDERAGRLFSVKALVVVGIRGNGGSAQLDAIDPTKGRAVTVPLAKVASRLGERVQVVHVLSGGPAANGAVPGAAATPAAQSLGWYAGAMNPAAGAIIATGWSIIKDLHALNASDDITYKLARLEGRMRPTADEVWDHQGTWTFRRTPVVGGPISVTYFGLADDVQNMTFEIEWQCNGHSIGPINIRPSSPNDALEWKLHVEADITPRADLVEPTSNAKAAVEVVFRYEHKHWVYQSQVYEERIILFADGRFERTPRWIQRGYGLGLSGGEGDHKTRSAVPVNPDPPVEHGVSPALPLPAGAQSAAFNAPPVRIPWHRGGRLDVNNHTSGAVTIRYRPLIAGQGTPWTTYAQVPAGSAMTLGVPPLVAGTDYEVELVDANGKLLRAFVFTLDPALGVHGEILS